MARFLSNMSLALVLSTMSAPALAAPPISTQGPGDGGAPDVGGSSSLSVVCQINGQSEPASVVNGTFRDAEGILDAIVTELEPGVFLIDTGQSTMVLTATSAQITGGPEAGKWDCVQVSAAPAPVSDPVTAPAVDPAALAALEQRLANARAALAATQDDLIGAILDRDAARNFLVDVEVQRDEAWVDLRGLQVELAAVREAQATAQAAYAAALLEARQLIRNGNLERAELETGLAAAEATNADLSAELAAVAAENTALSAELAAAQAEAEMAESDAGDDAASEEGTMTEEDTDMSEAGQGDQDITMMFDSDAAMAMLDAAEISDISRAALRAAVEQARANPAMIGEVMTRLQNAMGQ
jgi:hypothetical protein